mgnify:FL=1
MTAICKNTAAHQKKKAGGAEVVGAHLEGPFLSAAKKGAQNGAFLHDPDISMLKRLQEAAEGCVKLVTLAPEQPGAMEFIREAVSMGIAVSLGHTTADYDTAKTAFEAGANHTTHTYNAMPPFVHRNPGVIGAAFDSGAFAELICDGVHIHPSVVRATFRLFGKERMLLVSDTMRAAGMPDGNYTLGGQAVIVKGPLCTLEDGTTIAGSATNLMTCMRTAVSFGVPLADAVRACTFNPAQSIGIESRVGTLDAGKEASIVLLNQEDLSIRKIIFKGETVPA